MKKECKSLTIGPIPCQSGVEILGGDEFIYYLNEIKSLISCPNDIYKELYLTTLFNLAEFIQAMPFSRIDYDYSYGFLTRQLELAITTLRLRRGIFLPKNAGAEIIAAEDSQWTYALFSASLLKDLHILQCDREVTRQGQNGQDVNIWSPITGALYGKNHYYSINFTSKNSTHGTDVFMAAVTERIVPVIARSWLFNNDFLFAQWWEALLQVTYLKNDVDEIIFRAAQKAEIKLCSVGGLNASIIE